PGRGRAAVAAQRLRSVGGGRGGGVDRARSWGGTAQEGGPDRPRGRNRGASQGGRPRARRRAAGGRPLPRSLAARAAGRSAGRRVRLVGVAGREAAARARARPGLMRSGKGVPPRLIGLLIDLPDAARAALAERWGCAGAGPGQSAAATRELYAAMVDPERLAA